MGLQLIYPFLLITIYELQITIETVRCLSLIHICKRVRIYKPRFSVVAVHVVMKNIPYQSDTAYLKAHCEAYGVPFVQDETAFDPATDTLSLIHIYVFIPNNSKQTYNYEAMDQQQMIVGLL